MGKRGPAPKPTAVKKLEGTYRADRVAPNEMKPPVAIPVRPKWLSAAARQEWDRVVPVLAGLGVLTAVDGAVLEAFCVNYGLATAYQKKADKSPMVQTIYGPKPNPAAGEARRHWALVKQLGAELGLSPAARTRVSGGEGGEGGSGGGSEESDKAATWLFGPPKLVKSDAG